MIKFNDFVESLDAHMEVSKGKFSEIDAERTKLNGFLVDLQNGKNTAKEIAQCLSKISELTKDISSNIKKEIK